ncbi:MAG: hypothetical protein H7329_13375 [Opitutaceae bacterium]|nr:hypothetical protein [Cytophagales bacterium]
MVDQINSCQPQIKPQAKATIYPGVGHNAWTETYDNTGPGIAPDNIYDWLMRQTKKPAVITDIENQTNESSAKNIVFCFIDQISNELTVGHNSMDNEEAVLQIWNGSSDKLLEYNLQLVIGKNLMLPKLSDFPIGMLFIKLSYQNHSFSIKTILLQ